MVGVYNRNLAEHPYEPGSVGVYNRNLADHPNEPGTVGVYNRNLADHPNKPGLAGIRIGWVRAAIKGLLLYIYIYLNIEMLEFV